ncbi:l-ascorbate oxidase-like protein [Hordeum vulgare]|nr:l-ascorbate oxidase-like protein [Hordeum vulgare]
MEGSRSHGIRLRADGCYNGHVWVAADLSPKSAMFLMRGWKSFARSRGLGPGHLPHFRFDGSAAPSVKFFGATRVRPECSAESSSGSNMDFSSESNDDIIVFGVKLEGDNSEWWRPGRPSDFEE